MSLLEELVGSYAALSPDKQREVKREVYRETEHLRFIPNPGPQSDAVKSEADLLLYGGEAGGGKSSLLVGLAFTEHRRSLLMRRKYTDLSGLIDEAIDFNGSRKGFNGTIPQKFTIDGGKRIIQFGAVNQLGDEENWLGRARDLLGLDEAVHFEESQARMLMGWVRTKVQGQRARTIFATNPPVGSRGRWIIKMFRPWLDITHPNPAQPGELRWYIVDQDASGNPIDVEVEGPHFEYKDKGGKILIPKSRTFIPARLSDNPYLVRNKDYESQLDALPEPYRSAYRDGNFFLGTKDEPMQLIPGAWVRAAQQRWTHNGGDGVFMSAMGVDIAAGGRANTVIARRHVGWYNRLLSLPGASVPDGAGTAGVIVQHRMNNAKVVLDMGGGYGGELMRIFKDNGIDACGYKGASGSHRKSPCGFFKFNNRRSEAYWWFRCALDPNQPGGSIIALPPSETLFEDLTAPTFEIITKGIQVETKESVIAKLGRSPDEGDSVIMAWTEGPTTEADAISLGPNQRPKVPQVVMGHTEARRRRPYG